MSPLRFIVAPSGRDTIHHYLTDWRNTLGEGVEIDYRVYGSSVASGKIRRRPGWRGGIDALRRSAARARIRSLAGWPPRREARVVVFGDIERLSWAERRYAARLWQKLDASRRTRRILNHPTRSLCRYELLRRLHLDGVNEFNVYRLSEGIEPGRYPVFLRGEDDHDGPRSSLLGSPAALHAAIKERDRRGELREGCLIVEYCDTADAEGWIRKYGAFRVGDAIVPRHVFVGRQWMLKEASHAEGMAADEVQKVELDYLEGNPHERELMQLFQAAQIEYGRIDYGVKDGRIQVWEINTNPTILLPHHREDPDRGPVHRRFAEGFAGALRTLVS